MAGAVLATGVVWGTLGVARAQESQRCAAAFEEAQVSRKAGKLIQARESLVTCSQETCPTFIQSDCVKWLDEVRASIPTLMIVAQDAEGHDITDVAVSIEGSKVAESLGGTSIEANPGELQLSLEHGGTTLEKTLVLREGERNRRVEVVFGDDGASVQTIEGEASASLMPAYVLLGVGVVGVAGFTYFGLDATSQRDDLEKSCKPSCSQKQVDELESSELLADISLGIGLMSLGAAAYLLLTASGDDEVSGADTAVAVEPRHGGAVGWWRLRF